tara:strand:+ start:6755 stop:7090 length:336 start_codon:yes stop_codon:yes gene_type:complete
LHDWIFGDPEGVRNVCPANGCGRVFFSLDEVPIKEEEGAVKVEEQNERDESGVGLQQQFDPSLGAIAVSPPPSCNPRSTSESLPALNEVEMRALADCIAGDLTGTMGVPAG